MVKTIHNYMDRLFRKRKLQQIKVTKLIITSNKVDSASRTAQIGLVQCFISSETRNMNKYTFAKLLTENFPHKKEKNEISLPKW